MEKTLPKRWWTKRVVLPLLLLILAGFIGYWWWEWHLESALQEELAAIRTRGEPLEISDLRLPPIPPDQNAARLYRQACGKDAADPLALCRQARGRALCDWELPEDVHQWMQELTLLRGLWCMLETAATNAHSQGREAAALDYVRDCLHLADSTGQIPLISAHVIAGGLRSRTCSLIEEILPTLRIGPAPAASREDVRAVMAAILDETAVKGNLVRAVMGERVHLHRFAQGLLSGTQRAPTNNLGQAATPPARTTVLRDETRALRYYAQCVPAARQGDYPSMIAKLPPPREKWFFARPPVVGIGGPYDTVFALHCRMLAEGRMAALGLAIRVFESETGRRPPDLSSLAPACIPQIPTDPFTTGQPFCSKLTPGAGLLYSVDVNGKDDGGSAANVGGNPLDWPFYLDGNRPGKLPIPLAPATSPVTQPSARHMEIRNPHSAIRNPHLAAVAAATGAAPSAAWR